MPKKISSSPLVSVVMPSLNQAQFLEVAVRSVLEQDYTPLELVVVDGMSSDGSVEMLMRLQREYGDRLRWVSQKDSGPAQAINRALALAQGEVIGWLNSDDMYMPEAVAKAVAHLHKHPNHQMVYGQAHHIGAAGEYLGHYPTRTPSTPLDEFAQGSFICQPTVFMRRSALELVGALDEDLKLAFDFDLWLRFFKRFPKQVGMVRRVQACSRLHPACLTRRQRQQVALEGMQVIKKHLGTVPGHWVLTHIDELCEAYPLGADELPLVKQLEVFLKQARGSFKPEDWTQLLAPLKTDYRFALAKPGLYATVQPDGWVSKRVDVRYRWTEQAATAVLIKCKAAWPQPGKLRLKVRLPNGLVQATTVEAPDEFVLRLEVGDVTAAAGQMCWSIETAQGFVPAKHDPESKDRRKLAFLVTGLGLEQTQKVEGSV